MYRVLLTLAFAIMDLRGGDGGQMGNTKTSKTAQETVAASMKRFDEASKLWGRVNPMFFDLYDIQELCDTRPDKLDSIVFFQELTKAYDSDGYIRLKHSVTNTRDKIKTIVLTLLGLEQKAVVCRGMRHTLPMIAYSIFVDHGIHGSTADRDDERETVFDELFGTKFPDDGNFVRISETTEERGDDDDDDDNPIAANENKITETQIGFIEKIVTIFEILERFVERLYGFNDVDQVLRTMNSKGMNAASTHRRYLSSVFRDVEKMYRNQCFPGADATWLLGAENAEKAAGGKHTVPELIEEIDRLSRRAQLDLGLLTVKFHPVNAKKLNMADISIVYHHSVNKYYDPAVWELIGDERLTDGEDGSLRVVALNDMMAGYVTEIDRVMDAVTESMKRTVRCRCYLYVNLYMKLFRYVVQGLAENAAEIRRLFETAADSLAESKRYLAGNDSEKFLFFFEKFQYRAKHLTVRGRPKFGDPADRDYAELLSAVDELNRDGDDGVFKMVAAVYLQFCVSNIDAVVDNIDYYLVDMEFGMEFNPMAYDLRRTAVALNRQTVLALAEWYAWGERIYADDHCYPVNEHGSPDDHQLSTLNRAMKEVLFVETLDLTMGGLTMRYSQLNTMLEADLEQSIIWDY